MCFTHAFLCGLSDLLFSQFGCQGGNPRFVACLRYWKFNPCVITDPETWANLTRVPESVFRPLTEIPSVPEWSPPRRLANPQLYLVPRSVFILVIRGPPPSTQRVVSESHKFTRIGFKVFSSGNFCYSWDEEPKSKPKDGNSTFTRPVPKS